MKYFIDTEYISFDYSEEKENDNEAPYRITTFDKYGHYENEISLYQEQIDDLIKGFENYKKQKEK